MKVFDYQHWICQLLSQSGCRIKYLRKPCCSRINVCPSAIVQIESLYCLVTGGSKPLEKPPSFICNKSFTDTIFILKGVHHLPLLSFPLAAQPASSCLPHFTPPMHLFKALQPFLSSVVILEESVQHPFSIHLSHILFLFS